MEKRTKQIVSFLAANGSTDSDDFLIDLTEWIGIAVVDESDYAATIKSIVVAATNENSDTPLGIRLTKAIENIVVGESQFDDVIESFARAQTDAKQMGLVCERSGRIELTRLGKLYTRFDFVNSISKADFDAFLSENIAF